MRNLPEPRFSGRIQPKLPTIFYAGQYDGLLKGEFGRQFSLQEFEGSRSDAPLFLYSGILESFSEQMCQSVETLFKQNHPIVLVEPDKAEILRLIQILNINPDGYEASEELGKIVFVAFLQVQTGDLIRWSLFQADALSSDAGDVGQLKTWLHTHYLNHEKKLEQLGLMTERQEVVKSAAEKEGLLTDLAKAFVDQKNFRRYGNYYQVSHFIYSCHAIATQDDWYFVLQECVFNGRGAYTGKHEWYEGDLKDAAYWYMHTIELDNTIEGFVGQPAQVGMQKSSPDTANDQESITSGVSFNVGGEVSFQGKSGGGGLSGGVTISNSRSMTVKDCQVHNYSCDRANNAHWVYQFKNCEVSNPFLYAVLTDPPNLSVESFQPTNQWIWRMGPEVRIHGCKMNVHLKVGLMASVGVVDFYWAAHQALECLDGGTWDFTLDLPVPPVPNL